ncbi:2OG-Fe dioxygenase family protein [Endozoicomonas sp. SM1973]|uniref:2OG-Fe dioxygenase family protein n=1 Tax=Spartinivicinus marinus TaxID=2994442 RepID=A0A853I5P3_9GAMM|nr:2OG-Fe dioxygenase family protein [Spartinivicinus marinus]MCX4027371.1 2OG-Fe dioxygenase family protein [Spartinivicinus marinus]NYZ69220.1 2OG-Fe dioxygenase family protein [Spartinivicinus marinus]
MVLEKLFHPIYLFSVEDFDISPITFCSNIASYFYQLSWDNYLHRQNQIAYLQKSLTQRQNTRLSNEFWYYFFQGKIPYSDFKPIYQDLSPIQQKEFDSIQPNRRRAVSAYLLSFHNNQWISEQISVPGYNQNQAKVINHDQLDYRLATRFFPELPSHFVNDDLFCLLEGIAIFIRSKLGCCQLKITVHHNQTIARPGSFASNAPEGIHQDGQDLIVSALVVERKNLTGGKSIIFGADKTTCIVEKTLYSGEGILQPDLNTDLWHTVEATYSADGNNEGYRSTIGFDIEIIK